MTKSAMIRARVDPQLKDDVETILQELGLSTTQALTLFYQQIRLNRGIPFDLRLPDKKRESRDELPASRVSAPFPVDANRSIMEQNLEAYKSMHGELVERYLGQYVAICDRKLVDHDLDPVALLQRVRDHYPDQVILRQKVERMPERDLHIRHPQIEKSA